MRCYSPQMGRPGSWGMEVDNKAFQELMRKGQEALENGGKILAESKNLPAPPGRKKERPKPPAPISPVSTSSPLTREWIPQDRTPPASQATTQNVHRSVPVEAKRASAASEKLPRKQQDLS